MMLPVFELSFVIVQFDATRMLHAPHDVHDVVFVHNHRVQ